MAYSDFTLKDVERKLGVTLAEADLFPENPTAAVPDWLPSALARGTPLALLSEKSRSEFIVAPILLAAREVSGDAFAIFSGERLDVDAAAGLIGECDFILAAGPSILPIHAPLLILVEAQQNDIEGALGQCSAQMVAARKYNEAESHPVTVIYGCVTTGEVWQFLALRVECVCLDQRRLDLDDLEGILGVLTACVATPSSQTAG